MLTANSAHVNHPLLFSDEAVALLSDPTADVDANLLRQQCPGGNRLQVTGHHPVRAVVAPPREPRERGHHRRGLEHVEELAALACEGLHPLLLHPPLRELVRVDRAPAVLVDVLEDLLCTHTALSFYRGTVSVGLTNVAD